MTAATTMGGSPSKKWKKSGEHDKGERGETNMIVRAAFISRLIPFLLFALVGCAMQVPEPPGPYYKKVSQLVHFPDYYPGLGIIYVQPTTLPYGPFQGYDRQGRLVDTIYMVPISDFDKHTSITKIEGTPLPVDHVDIFYNSGHPGVDVPHYHIILWHITREQQAALQ